MTAPTKSETLTTAATATTNNNIRYASAVRQKEILVQNNSFAAQISGGVERKRCVLEIIVRSIGPSCGFERKGVMKKMQG